MPTLGEIAKSHGFDNLSDYYNHINKLVEIEKSKSLNVGDEIKLKKDFTPTHFKQEDMLSYDTNYLITDKSNFTLGRYSVKIDGFDDWFPSTIFELISK